MANSATTGPRQHFELRAPSSTTAVHNTSEQDTSLTMPANSDPRQKLRKLESEEFQLWSMYALIVLALTAGFAAAIAPAALDGTRHPAWRYLPQLLSGLIALVILLNAYVFQQRRRFSVTREELVAQLTRGQIAEHLALVDPLTEIYNRRFLDQILAKETNRADRNGTSLTIAMIDVDKFKAINSKFGHQAGDHILCEVAQLLRQTFRGSDTVVRYGGDEFLVIMPETNEQQASHASVRLSRKVQEWNRTSTSRIPGYSMSLSCGVATYRKGKDMREVIESADQRMFAMK